MSPYFLWHSVECFSTRLNDYYTLFRICKQPYDTLVSMSGIHCNIIIDSRVSHFLSESVFACGGVAAATSTNKNKIAAKNLATKGQEAML